MNLETKKDKTFARVWFSNRGLAKVVKNVESLPESVPNRSTVFDVADILKDVKVDNLPPVGFKSLPELQGIDYVGYIIEKERLNKDTGEWVRIDEYKIIGSDSNNFLDSRVAYGNFYRYRIRSVVKVTIKTFNKSLLNYEALQDLRRFQADSLRREIRSREEVIANIDRITNNSILKKTSRGKKNRVFDLISGFKVQASPEKTEIVKVSTSSARERFLNLRRRKVARVDDVEVLKGTVTRERLQKSINDRLKVFRESFEDYTSFYYKSEPSENWRYVTVTEKVPPPPPSAIKIIPTTPARQIFITWLKPANQQRDIKEFRLYRRNRLGEEWSLVKAFAENENIYVDTNVEVNKTYIYALSSVDVHGIESVLSTQIQAELNATFNLDRRERPLRWVSGSGARPEEDLDFVFKKFVDLPLPIIARENILVGPTTKFKETNKKFVVRVKSLDTHEVKEFVLSLKNENIRKFSQDD